MSLQNQKNFSRISCRIQKNFSGINFTVLIVLLWIFLVHQPDATAEQHISNPTPIEVSLTTDKPQKKISLITEQDLSKEEFRQLLDKLPRLINRRVDPLTSSKTKNPIRPAASIVVPIPKQSLSASETNSEKFLPPLQIEQYSPKDQLLNRAHASFHVRFNQNMVALGSSDKNNSFLPINLTPSVAGKWHWSDSKTIEFIPDEDSWPGSTTFTAKVERGATALSGASMEKESQSTFSTPTLRIKKVITGQYRPNLQPFILIQFDQEIDPAEVLRHLKGEINLGYGKKEPISFELAKFDEYSSDKIIKRQLNGSKPQLVVKCSKIPDSAQNIKITLTAGAPSKEGPNRTESEQEETESLQQKFQVRALVPSTYYENREKVAGCLIKLTDYVDSEQEEDDAIAKLVEVSPKESGSKIKIIGDTIQVLGLRRNKQYTVTVSKALRSSEGEFLNKTFRSSTTVKHGRLQDDFFDEDSELRCPQNFLICPSSKLMTDVFSRGFEKLKVSAYKVEISDFNQFLNTIGLKNSYESIDSISILKMIEGKDLIKSYQIPVDEDGGSLGKTRIGLKPFLTEHPERILLVFEGKDFGKTMQYCQWVELGDLALDCWANSKEISAWCSDAQKATPISGAELSIVYQNNIVSISKTNSDGLAKLSIPAGIDDSLIMIARTSTHSLILPAIALQQHRQWYDWYVVHDRGVYRPGERCYFKGWVRQLKDEVGADFEPPDLAHRSIIAIANDATGLELYKERCSVNEYGGFDGAFIIPKTANLGPMRIKLQIEGTSESKGLEVELQEFRRPDYKVTVSKLDAATVPKFAEPIRFLCEANYYSSASASNAECKWNAEVTRSYFRPEGWQQFCFYCDQDLGQAHFETTGKTDNEGKCVSTAVINGTFGGPINLRIRSTVTDVNRQSQENAKQIVVHSCNYYAGIKGECQHKEGSTKELEFCGQFIVTDPNGLPKANNTVKLTLNRYEKSDITRPKSLTIQSISLPSSTVPVDFRFPIEAGRSYFVKAEVIDEKERVQTTSLSFDSITKENDDDDLRYHLIETANLNGLILKPDHDEYRSGETPSFKIKSLIADGFGLLTVQEPGKISTFPFRVQNHNAFLSIPTTIKKSDLQVEAVVLGKLEKSSVETMGADALDFAFCDRASLKLKLNRNNQQLNVTLNANSAAKLPGSQCLVTAQVKSARGELLPNCEVMLFAVDEAALNLSDYRPKNPDLFANFPELGAKTYSQEYVSSSIYLLAALEQLKQQLDEQEIEGVRSASPTIRTNFVPTAVFKASLITDSEGKVQTSFNLPDNITNYKIYAIAADKGMSSGMGSMDLKVQPPLVLRPSPPRSLNLTDQFELPIVVQNTTNKDEVVSIVARGEFAKLRKGVGKKVFVQAGDRVEVRFPCIADQIGDAQVQAIAVAGRNADAAQTSIPVLLPNSKETVANYGTISGDRTVEQKIELPADTMKDFGGIEVSASSSQFQELKDASQYIEEYPYDCSEQIAARIISTTTLKGLFNSFQLTPVSKDYSIENELTLLASRQNKDGSFSLWQKGETSYPYVSIFVTHSLVVAKKCGYRIPDAMLEQASKYLRTIGPNETANLSATLRAYALFVRSLLKEDVTEAAVSLSKNANQLSPEGVVWLMRAANNNDEKMRSELKSRLLNQVYETASTAGLKSSDAVYGFHRHLMFYSDTRADALLLDALIEHDPSSYLLPKLMKGLLSKRKNGHWLNTQENAFAALALSNYFNRFESEPPDFDLRAWVGDEYLLENKFVGRSLATQNTLLPMEALRSHQGSSNLTLQKKGKGILYYRLALNYAPASPLVMEQNNGFEVKRRYESIGDEEDIRKDSNGVLHVKAGAMLRVTINIRVDGSRFQTALVDHLPAGFETVNDKLLGTAQVHLVHDSDNQFWYDHVNLRDDRVEVFCGLLLPGVYQYSYYVRATTPGRFLAVPAKAEEMYNPETYGRCSTTIVEVK